jgi:hypothetical protein
VFSNRNRRSPCQHPHQPQHLPWVRACQQGKTIVETLEIARDVARKLLETMAQRNQSDNVQPVTELFDYPLVILYCSPGVIIDRVPSLSSKKARSSSLNL